MGFAEDDFYYYLKTAQNFAAGRGSTFDGSTQTNGYHPLYFLLLAAVSRFIRGIRGVFAFLWLLDTASAVVIFCAARRIVLRTVRDVVLAQVLGVLAMLPCLATISMQMETTLALPLGFVLLDLACVAPERYTARRCASLGLVSGLLVLARLDGAFLILLLLGGLLLVPGMRTVFRPVTVASFAVAALPLPVLYFRSNLHYFHIFLPISGLAKELRHGWLPDPAILRPSFSGFTLLIFAVACLAGVGAVLMRRRLRPEETLLCFAAMLMPVALYGTELVISDWKLWPWYMYATRYAFFASLVVVAVLLRSVCIHTRWIAPALLVCALLALARTRYKIDPAMMDIEKESEQLNAFASTHPGRYAMGDRAGMFGFRSASPLLQAEGLMMDRAYLQHIRDEDDLRSTLARYGTKYYIAYVFDTDATRKLRDGCFAAEEPSNAGRYALRMRSTLCDPPVYTLKANDGMYLVYALRP